MMLYTTFTVAEVWKNIEEGNVESPETLEMTAELTIRGVFMLILEKDDGVWN